MPNRRRFVAMSVLAMLTISCSGPTPPPSQAAKTTESKPAAGAANPAASAKSTGAVEGRINVDRIGAVVSPAAGSVVRVDSKSNQILHIGGWAFLSEGATATGSVVAEIDGQPHPMAEYGIDRSDVARTFNDERYRLSGFNGQITVAALTPGRHQLTFRIVGADGATEFRPNYTVTLEIV